MDPLLIEIVGGIATAVFLGIVAGGYRQYREWRVRQLDDIRQDIVELRNTGTHVVPDPAAWVEEAQQLQAEAETRARRVSSASHRLLRTLGQLQSFPVDPNVTDPAQRRWVNELTSMDVRMQEILARHDK